MLGGVIAQLGSRRSTFPPGCRQCRMRHTFPPCARFLRGSPCFLIATMTLNKLVLLSAVALLALGSRPAVAEAAAKAPDGFALPWSLPPEQLVEALALLAETRALQAALSSPGPQERLAAARKELIAILPQLEGADDAKWLQLMQEAAGSALARLAAVGLNSQRPSRLARTLTLVNIAWFLGCCMLVLGAAALVFTHLAPFVAALIIAIPVVVWEAAGYAASFFIMHRATLAAPSTAPYIGLTALLAFTATACASAALHLRRRFEQDDGRVASLALGLMTLVWGAGAVRLQASLLGTITVWWALSALGFFIAVFPFLTVIGFRSGMARPLGASLALIALFLPFKAAPDSLQLPPLLRPFESGVWVWCPLVANLANLLMVDRSWSASRRYSSADGPEGGPPPTWMGQALHIVAAIAWLMASQLIPLVVIGATLACGLVLEVEPCRAIGAVFGFLWFLTLLAQFNWKRIGIAWGALVFGGVLWGAAYSVHTWPAMWGLRSS